jgi:tRNA dimethylallyltransferase
MPTSLPISDAASADGHRPVALIAGPTASGKSAMALALAHALRDAGREAVIVNADASQVYRDIPILSAAPTAAEMKDVRHVLVGHIDGAIACNAAMWAEQARDAIDAAHADGATPIIAGGTGLYIQALLRGIAPVPPIDEGIRQSVRALPVDQLCRMLAVHDPDATARLNPADTNRITRALEVVLSTGTPLHVWQEQRSGGISDRIALSPLLLLPPREWLRARCDVRLAAMFAAGAEDEVLALLNRRLDPSLPAMTAIGVPQIAEWLTGEFSPEQGYAWPLAQAQLATRQFAKRQYTFFRGQFPADWPRFTDILNDDNVIELVIKLRNSLLTG